MSQAADNAAIELRIDWEQDGILHCNRQFFGNINFRRDILPGTLSVKLPDSAGEWISEQFAPGELLPAWSENNFHTLQRSALQLTRRHGPALRICRGRHYPRYIAAGTVGIRAENVQPLRITQLDDVQVTIDLNHPLARAPLTVSARIDRSPGHDQDYGGRSHDLITDAVNCGPGLEALQAPGATDYHCGEPFARIDARDDALFYHQPRLVQHLDSRVRAQITALYGHLLQPGMQVLDLMASWVSHLPDTNVDLQVTGLGMNEQELAANPRLATRVVHDLNATPSLPFADSSFDAVICTASIEYLVQPVAVIHELARVLKPGALVVITFSDRCFPSKAIALWSDLHPFERLALVQEYLRSSAVFAPAATETVRGYPRPEDDRYAGQLQHADPLFATWARRRGESASTCSNIRSNRPSAAPR